MTKPTKQSHSFEFKVTLVELFLHGEAAQDLAAEAWPFLAPVGEDMGA